MDWIKISEKTPNEFSKYLVCLQNNAIFIAYYTNSRGFFTIEYGDFKQTNPVTHWAEIPEGANKGSVNQCDPEDEDTTVYIDLNLTIKRNLPPWVRPTILVAGILTIISFAFYVC